MFLLIFAALSSSAIKKTFHLHFNVAKITVKLSTDMEVMRLIIEQFTKDGGSGGLIFV